MACELTFQFGNQFCNPMPSTVKLFSGCESIYFLMEKKSLHFSSTRLLCCMSIFFHIKRKRARLDYTQKRCISEIPFQNPFKAGNWLKVGGRSQSASSNHALLITKSAFLIKKKCPLSQPTSKTNSTQNVWWYKYVYDDTNRVFLHSSNISSSLV